MGLFVSKPDPSFPVSQKRSRVSDDGQSRATATTEDSSVMPRSPPSSNSISKSQRTHLELKHGRQSWRSGYQSAPNFSQVTHSSRKPEHFATSDVPMLIRRDSDPCMGNGRRPSVPVKCPPRCGRATATTNHTGTMTVSSPPDGEDSHYLMRLYDTRTWEMYRRITEARKTSEYSYTRNTANTKLDNNIAGENTSEWENLQHDYPDSEGGHDMIFLFDFD